MISKDIPPIERLDKQARWLEQYRPSLRISEQGTVISVGDGIAWISGLPSIAMEDLLLFADGSQAMVFDLNEELVGAVLLHESESLSSGTLVYPSQHTLSVQVGDELLGRIIDPLGQPLDGHPEPDCKTRLPLERPSPPIVDRDFVEKPLYTGIKVIDTLIPIAKGQRQLLIGDEGLGRSSIALDTIINQRDKSVFCIYVLIGQKRSTVVNTIETLRHYGALDYTTVVVAEATALPGLQHLAPFAGCAIAEYWMQQGKDTLVIYDDLTNHAKTYRELSLLLRRPPGREAYPGDIFSTHARLLERATCLNATAGGGSMSALPIIETEQGEIAAYIPTNLISITDGQFYLERNLFTAGFRPAIDIAKSVSRIGGKAQHKSIKMEAGQIKLDYLQFLELEAFTRFGARLESSMERAIQRGRILREIFKQERFSPLSVELQMIWLVAFNDGHFDNCETDDLPALLSKLNDLLLSSQLTLDSPREKWAQLISQLFMPGLLP